MMCTFGDEDAAAQHNVEEGVMDGYGIPNCRQEGRAMPYLHLAFDKSLIDVAGSRLVEGTTKGEPQANRQMVLRAGNIHGSLALSWQEPIICGLL